MFHWGLVLKTTDMCMLHLGLGSENNRHVHIFHLGLGSENNRHVHMASSSKSSQRSELTELAYLTSIHQSEPLK